MLSQKRRGLLAAVIMVVGCWPGTATAECPTDPICSGAAPGDEVVDPYNCTMFYVCLDDGEPSSNSFPCEPEEYFDPVAGCTPGTDCTPLCQSTLVGCKTTCVEPNEYINDPSNCGQYYLCLPGEVLGPYDCEPETSYFDVVNQDCSADSSVCCDPCTPICNLADVGKEIPDPNDCTRFYICTAQGPPDPSYHGTCPSGQVYVPGLKCQPEEEHECDVPCPDGTLVVPSTPSSSSIPTRSIPTSSTTTSSSIPTSSTTTSSSLTTTTTSDTANSTPTTTTSNTANSTPTTTSTTTSTSTTTTSPPDGLCHSHGNYATCDQCCVPEYLYCSSPGTIPSLRTCESPLVFNPYPEYPFCVYSYQCPCSICSMF